MAKGLNGQRWWGDDLEFPCGVGGLTEGTVRPCEGDLRIEYGNIVVEWLHGGIERVSRHFRVAGGTKCGNSPSSFTHYAPTCFQYEALLHNFVECRRVWCVGHVPTTFTYVSGKGKLTCSRDDRGVEGKPATDS